MRTRKHATATRTTDPITLASEAVAALKEVANRLPIDDTLSPQSLASTRVASRVPLEVMNLASSILNENPDQ